MNLENLLEKRHEARVEWVEPWKACGPEGNALDAHVTISCTVHDAVNLQRSVAKQLGQSTMGRDSEHLAYFIAVHWAKPVDDSESGVVASEPARQSIVPTVLVMVAAIAAFVWIIHLWSDNVQLTLGAPSGYRLESLGYGSLGSPHRTTTDGWTSNVGSKAAAIRRAWKHWESGFKPEWQEAK